MFQRLRQEIVMLLELATCNALDNKVFTDVRNSTNSLDSLTATVADVIEMPPVVLAFDEA